MKKNNTAEKTALNAQKISEAIKNGARNSLQQIMAEAVSKIIKETDDDEDDEDVIGKDEDELEDKLTDNTDTEENENDFDVEDVDTDETDSKTDVDSDEDTKECEDGECDVDDAKDDDWSDMEDFKVNDTDYDLTGEDGEVALKIFNKLGDDDNIFVTKDENGNYNVKDDETGAEYVIELDADAEDNEKDFDDDEDEEPEAEFEIDVDGVDDDEDDDDDDDDDDLDIELVDSEDDVDDDDDEDEDDEDDSEIPNRNDRPFSGYKNAKTNLFTKDVNEAAKTVSSQPDRKVTKSNKKQIRPNAPEYFKTKVDSPLTVETVKKITKKAKALQEENKKYASYIKAIKNSLYEAALSNVSLGQIVKLMTENTTSAEEKKNIVERFSNVKTIKESKMLYENFKNQLKANKGSNNNVMLEKQITVKDKSKMLNETTIYQNNPSLGLWNRMENLYKD